MKGVSIQNMTRSASGRPRRVYTTIATELLPDWEISLAFVGPTRAQALNVALRNKSYTPNVLSYALGEKSGEIIICPAVARKEASAHNMSEENFILYLFIHGVLHIKGWAHGARMEECEQKMMAQYATTSRRAHSHVTKNSNRH